MTTIWPRNDSFMHVLDAAKFSEGLTLKFFQKPRDDKVTWHEVIKALSRLVFWKYKLRGKLLLKIKLSYCSWPLTPLPGLLARCLVRTTDISDRCKMINTVIYAMMVPRVLWRVLPRDQIYYRVQIKSYKSRDHMTNCNKNGSQWHGIWHMSQ